MPSKTHATSVKAVLFDYGLVLSGPPDPQAWEQMKEILRADEESFHAAYWKPRHDYDRGALKGPAYWRAVAADLGQELDPEQLQNLLDADIALWTQPNQPMIAWAAQLQAAGVRTGILSNIGDEMEVGILALCPWMERFHHHTFSHRLGTAKPDPSIYAFASRGLDTAPAQILFIDDRADNIQAAHEAGMQAIQYTDHDSFVQALQEAGHGALLHPAPKVEAT